MDFKCVRGNGNLLLIIHLLNKLTDSHYWFILIFMKHLYFDESGYTGNNLLDTTQPTFCYLGLDCTPELQNAFISLKSNYKYSNTEVKGTNVVKHTVGQKLLRELWLLCAEKTKFFLVDKKFALAAKMFEYVYEPVFADHNVIIYNSGFHIFFTNFLYWNYFTKSDASAESIFANFQEFIKEGKKKIDFVNSIKPVPKEDDPLYSFFKFCQLYKDKIASDITFTDSFETWILDVTDTGLFSLLTAFEGDSIEPLQVVCDDSKPVTAFKDFLDIEVGDTRKLYAGIREHKQGINFNLADKVKMESSKNCIPLQIADFLAASVIYAYNKDDEFAKDIRNIAVNCMTSEVSLLPVSVSDYTDEEIQAYFEMMDILSDENIVYREILHAVWLLSRFIKPCHKFDLLKYLKG